MPLADAQADLINAALSVWRQGDVICSDQGVFVHLADLTQPLTQHSEAAAEAVAEVNTEAEMVVTKPLGLIVVSQTCDIVRDCRVRPFVEICPLVQVPELEFDQIVKRQRPRFAWVKATANDRWVADLDRTMCVEKSVLAAWPRTPNHTVDVERREFGDALARRRSRFAFPDDFTENYVKPLQQRIKTKHNKQSDEGRFLRALREIRIRAVPDWDQASVTIDWWFIVEDEPEPLDTPEKGWAQWVEFWLDLLGNSAKYTVGWSQVVRLEDITARDYVESDRLDFDHLSDQ